MADCTLTGAAQKKFGRRPFVDRVCDAIDDVDVDTSGVAADVDDVLEDTQIGLYAAISQLVLQSTDGTLTADGTEQTIYQEQSFRGISEPVCLVLDLDAMEAGDTTVIRIYQRLGMLSGLEQWSYTSYAGADGGLANGNTAAVIDLIPSHHGFEITLEQTGGTNRAYPWQLFVRAPT